MLLDPDPHSQYGSGSRTAKFMRSRIHNTALNLGMLSIYGIQYLPSIVKMLKHETHLDWLVRIVLSAQSRTLINRYGIHYVQTISWGVLLQLPTACFAQPPSWWRPAAAGCLLRRQAAVRTCTSRPTCQQK
jgi:hypothetical protein